MDDLKIKQRENGHQPKAGGLTPNQKFLLRLRTFPKRALRVLLVLDAEGQVQSAVFEDAGKVERFG